MGLWISQRRRLIDTSKIGMPIFRSIQGEPGRKSGVASGSYLHFLRRITAKIRVTDDRFPCMTRTSLWQEKNNGFVAVHMSLINAKCRLRRAMSGAEGEAENICSFFSVDPKM